ncbi:MAG: hypothetical protein KC585_04115, partial [Candidatus Magasanikbacteria bacterium]|nr:hypothetical protein [Candidatus Magasanikbacteria bacterium]
SLESIPEEFTFTEVKGNLNLVSLKSLPEGFTFPEIGGYLSLRSLKSLPEGFTFPEIGGNLYLDSLTSGKGVRIPASCRGRVTMNKNALNEIEWI